MNYVGIDWAYGRAAWCAMGEAGEIKAEGLIPASRRRARTARLEARHRGQGRGRDDERSGLGPRPARARGLGDGGRPRPKGQRRGAACLQDRQGRRPGPGRALPARPDPGALGAIAEDRAIRELLRRRSHLVKSRTSERNRIFGLFTQFGLRVSLRRLREPDAMELLERRGVPEVWRVSIAGPPRRDRSSRPADLTDRPRAADRSQARIPARGCSATIPGIGPLIGLTFASEIGEVSRFSSPSKLVGYAGLAPRISQSGERSATGRLSKAGSKTLRWAAVEAANQAWRSSNPFHAHYLRIAAKHGKNPAKSAVARKLLITTWHMLSRGEVFRPAAQMAAP